MVDTCAIEINKLLLLLLPVERSIRSAGLPLCCSPSHFLCLGGWKRYLERPFPPDNSNNTGFLCRLFAFSSFRIRPSSSNVSHGISARPSGSNVSDGIPHFWPCLAHIHAVFHCFSGFSFSVETMAIVLTHPAP